MDSVIAWLIFVALAGIGILLAFGVSVLGQIRNSLSRSLGTLGTGSDHRSRDDIEFFREQMDSILEELRQSIRDGNRELLNYLGAMGGQTKPPSSGGTGPG
ncbi:MAG: hypothetical protein ACE5IR_10510 [bacterium]